MNRKTLGRIGLSGVLVIAHSLSSARTELRDDLRWALCPIQNVNADKPISSDPARPAGTIELRADRTDLPREGIQEFSGNVEIIQDQRALSAQSITYSEEAGVAEINGNASYWDNSVYWKGERGQLELENETASLENGVYELIFPPTIGLSLIQEWSG